MRLRSLVPSALVVATLSALAVVAACSSGGGTSGPVSSPGGDGAAPPPGAGDAPSAAAPTPEAPATAAPADTGAAVAKCVEAAAEITNDPPTDGGVAMNNATTAGDAGGSDRLVPMIHLVQSHRDRFRCCFDIWGHQNAGREVRVTFAFQLDPAGKLVKAGYKADETDIQDATVEKCMQDVAATMTFPPSPSGKETRYNHRFQFRAKAKR